MWNKRRHLETGEIRAAGPSSRVTMTPLGTRPLNSYAYLLVAVLSPIALLLTFVFWPYITDIQYVFVSLVTVICAWYGGFLPGFIAAFMTMMGINFFLIEPRFTFISSQHDVVQMVFQLLVATLMCFVLETRQRAEFALQQSRDQLYAILHGVADGITVQAQDGSFLYANGAAAEILGFEHPAVMIDQHVSRIEHRYTLTDEKGDPLKVPMFLNNPAFIAGQPMQKVMRMVPADGGPTRWVNMQSTPIRNALGFRFAVNVLRDVTERKQWEMEQTRLTMLIEMQRLRLRNLVTNVPGVIWESTRRPDGLIQVDFVNDAAEKLFGYTREEWMQEPRFFSRLLHPDDVARVFEEIRPQMENGGTILTNFRVVTKDGRTLFVEARSTVTTGHEDGNHRVYGVMTDVTEREHARIEQARLTALVADQHNRLENTLANVSSAIYEMVRYPEGEGRYELAYINEAGIRLFGYSHAEWDNLMELHIRMIHPDDRARVEAEERAVFPAGRFITRYRVFHADGHLMHVEVQSTIQSDPETGILRYYGMMSDVSDRIAFEDERNRLTALVEAERQRLHNTIANVPGILWEGVQSDVDTLRIDFVNDAAERILGYPREDWLRSNMFLHIIHPDDQAQAAERWREMWSDGGNVLVQFRCIAADGRIVWVDAFSSILHQPDGKTRIYGVMLDATHRHRTEEQLAQSARELVRSNEELQQFAYVASHDLQEPLRMVTSYLQLLDNRYRDRLDDDAREFISYAVDGAVRMKGLIGDLLAYSRVDSRGKAFTQVPLDRVLQQAISNLRLAIEERGAVVQADDLPTVMGDEGQLVQLFQNLIGNAIKFAGERVPEVSVTVRYEDEMWVLSFGDTGIGIEPQYLERIFVIFQRLHTKGRYPGTGIGLAICKKVVERHGGRIWAESTPGVGSTFSFTLPAIERPALLPSGGAEESWYRRIRT
jgi:PAS domain S-box-containing protein